MPDSAQRLILRITLKLFAFIALFSILYVLFSTTDEGTDIRPAATPIRFDLNTLQAAQPQRLEWAGGALQLLRMPNTTAPYLFFDRGGNLNCPLVWQAPGNSRTPLQPWPGGFRDQCNGVWYRYDGQVLPGQGHQQDLQTPNYSLLNGHLLVIGGNGDNAALATSPVN